MGKDKGDVVIFPKWKSSLENEAIAAFSKKQYDKALKRFNQLIEFDVATERVILNKLICLMELGQYGEAERLSSEQLDKSKEHYFYFLHIHLTVLFQTGQYEALMDILDDVKESSGIPPEMREQMDHIYEVSEKLRAEESRSEQEENLNELLVALNSDDFQLQWRLISRLRKGSIHPYLRDIASYLEDEKTQPVIKTVLLQWMHAQKVEMKVHVKKFGQSEHVIPEDLHDILHDPASVHILKLLSDVEQMNPTLYDFAKQLLFRYMFVRYPMMPEDKELPYVAKAVLELSYTYLQLEDESLLQLKSFPTEEVQVWKQQIEYYEVHYYSIMGQ
ncbi:hypothetical protein [Pontibacillus litoralis]|uniref:Uncharacterized protein n=1 Tax=Pontibacillus litoralis JSM 072002 TaxID=1385512 RepID=A0A0A5GDK6_9BACI|nr:hypothetical protein [Pontibacillus litoralis]KGX89205.1 hypothetical protein N784_01500 [Pontibacillus litoralis JSM 072002]